MDQGVIHAFKALYTRKPLQHLIEAMYSGDSFLLKKYWRGYTIKSCLQITEKAIKEMKNKSLNASQKKLWLEAVHDYKGFSSDQIHHSIVDKAMKLAKLPGDGFTDMTTEDTTEDVNNLIEAHTDPLMD